MSATSVQYSSHAMDYGGAGKSSLRNELMQESSDIVSAGEKVKEEDIEVIEEPEDYSMDCER